MTDLGYKFSLYEFMNKVRFFQLQEWRLEIKGLCCWNSYYIFTSELSVHQNSDIFLFLQYLQVVYNANNLAKLVAKKKSLQNWLVYYQTKHERNPGNRPIKKVFFT